MNVMVRKPLILSIAEPIKYLRHHYYSPMLFYINCYKYVRMRLILYFLIFTKNLISAHFEIKTLKICQDENDL